MIARSLAVWLLLVLAEIGHGIARGLLLLPYAGDFRSRQIGVFTGSLIILAVAVACVRWLRAQSLTQFIGIGLLWLLLMLGFELAFGRFVMGASWARIGSDYNLPEGGLLPIGMLILAASPVIAAKIRGLI